MVKKKKLFAIVTDYGRMSQRSFHSSEIYRLAGAKDYDFFIWKLSDDIKIEKYKLEATSKGYETIELFLSP